MIKMLQTFCTKYQTAIIIALVLLAAFLRLYRIGAYLTFLGDEGRDVLVVKHILEGQFTLLGPRASAGDFYTGPIYYYMIAPFLFLSHLDPVGPAIFIALLSTITTYFIYQFGKKWVGISAALIAASLYAVSPLVLTYSRSSWNPNPMPFFAMVIFYLLYKGVKRPTLVLLGLVGIFFGIAFQLHYIEAITGVIILSFVAVGNFLVDKKKAVICMLQQYLSVGGGFLLGWSPFLAFEIRHGFPNIRTIINFVVHGDPKATDLTHNSFIFTIWDVFTRLFGRLLFRFPLPQQFNQFDHTLLTIWYSFIVVVSITCVFALFRLKDRLAKSLLGLWLLFGVVLFGFYHKPIYDYYFEFMFPLPFLLFGNLLVQIHGLKKSAVLTGGIAIFMASLIIFNLFGSPFTQEPNRQKDQIQHIAEFVQSKTAGKPFNFALLTKGNSDHAYRYYFELEGHSPVVIKPEYLDPTHTTVTDQLFIVCEDLDCTPLGASLFEVAGFGRAEILDMWDIRVVKIYVMIHYTGK